MLQIYFISEEKPILLLRTRCFLSFFVNKHDQNTINRYLKTTFMLNFEIGDSLLFISLFKGDTNVVTLR